MAEPRDRIVVANKLNSGKWSVFGPYRAAHAKRVAKALKAFRRAGVPVYAQNKGGIQVKPLAALPTNLVVPRHG